MGRPIPSADPTLPAHALASPLLFDIFLVQEAAREHLAAEAGVLGPGRTRHMHALDEMPGACKGAWPGGEGRVAGLCDVQVARRTRLSWVGRSV